VAKPEWGTKRVCQSCGGKFYDFDRSPILCPNCGATFDPETLLRAKRGKAAPAKAKVSKVEDDEVEVTLDDDEDLADIEEDDDLVENVDELGDDDDGVTNVARSDDDEKDD